MIRRRVRCWPLAVLALSACATSPTTTTQQAPPAETTATVPPTDTAKVDGPAPGPAAAAPLPPVPAVEPADGKEASVRGKSGAHVDGVGIDGCTWRF